MQVMSGKNPRDLGVKIQMLPYWRRDVDNVNPLDLAHGSS